MTCRKVAIPIDASEHSERACDCKHFSILTMFYRWFVHLYFMTCCVRVVVRERLHAQWLRVEMERGIQLIIRCTETMISSNGKLKIIIFPKTELLRLIVYLGCKSCAEQTLAFVY